MGRNHRGPYSAATCRKVSDTCRFIHPLDKEARRQYLAARPGAVAGERDRRARRHEVFDLAGIDPLTRRRFAMHLEMSHDASLLDFLLLVMRCAKAPCGRRQDRLFVDVREAECAVGDDDARPRPRPCARRRVARPLRSAPGTPPRPIFADPGRLARMPRPHLGQSQGGLRAATMIPRRWRACGSRRFERMIVWGLKHASARHVRNRPTGARGSREGAPRTR